MLTGAYALGHISGGHFNPAVTIGLWVAGRIEAKAVPPFYIIVQVIGGIAAGGLLYGIASGKSGFKIDAGSPGAFATNGYGDLSPPHGYSLVSALLIEIVLTAVFIWVILGATDKRAPPQGFGPIAIGLALTLIHLISIPVTNTSVNPARSLGVAVYNPAALGQVWLFWVAPIVGALIAGVTYSILTAEKRMDPAQIEDTQEALTPVS